jgi:hypothetical protein
MPTNFPVLDTLPRNLIPQAVSDAATRQLESAPRGTDTRPLLADEYPAHIAGRESFSSLLRGVPAGLLVALLLQVAGYALLVVALDATTTLPHFTTYDGSPISEARIRQGMGDFISYPAWSPLFPWLPKLVCIPRCWR